MCGLWGFVARDLSESVDLRILRTLATANERRGPHAHGWAWMTADGEVQAYHAVGPVSKGIDALDMVEGAVLLLGHVRWATAGRKDDARCVHPWPVFSNGWMAHNGTIDRAADLRREWGLRPSSACDSELLSLITQESDRQRRVERLADALGWAGEYAEHRHDHAVMAIWPRALAVLRSGKPLSVGGDGSTGAYISSLGVALALAGCGNVARFPTRHAARYSFGADGQARVTMHKLTKSGAARRRDATEGDMAPFASGRPRTRVFVYGTLKKGHGNNRLLSRAEFAGAACTTSDCYAMRSLGGFPAVHRTASDGVRILGELYDVDAETLEQLDRLEGHPAWYRRQVISTSGGPAWCYLMPEADVADKPLVEDGEWLGRGTPLRRAAGAPRQRTLAGLLGEIGVGRPVA